MVKEQIEEQKKDILRMSHGVSLICPIRGCLTERSLSGFCHPHLWYALKYQLHYITRL